jgi:hypothetical protein
MTAAIHPGEVVDVLVRAMRDKSLIASGLPIWNGHTEYMIDGWRITFFINDGVLDIIEDASAPDGRHSTFDHWVSNDDLSANPIELLTFEDCDTLNEIVTEA